MLIKFFGGPADGGALFIASPKPTFCMQIRSNVVGYKNSGESYDREDSPMRHALYTLSGNRYAPVYIYQGDREHNV